MALKTFKKIGKLRDDRSNQKEFELLKDRVLMMDETVSCFVFQFCVFSI